MITATTRRCPACSRAIELEDTTCPHCGRVQAPAVDEWGENARRLICLLVIAEALGPNLEQLTEQQIFERLMARVIRGRWYPGGFLVAQSADASDCLPRFREVHARWIEAGQPNAFADAIRIRGGR